MSVKLAVISGASSGIGFACVNRFLGDGFDVVNISRNRPVINESVQQSPGSLTHIDADFRKSDWADDVASKLNRWLTNRASITLVHNAAILEKDSIKNVDAERLREVLQVNLIAVSQLNQLCLPYMNTGSSILYIGSTLSEKGVGNTASYVVSKHALAGLMKCTVHDLAGEGIHCACICPGFTDTEMLNRHLGEHKEMIESMVSFGRLLEPNEIAELVFFCSSNPSVNGAMLHANLGQVER